ncbi:MAG: sulfite exporter TauE/SafE family protein [Myxococcales bacterium]|nr:sulfite exporter TauE/SafE family protein [Myxococcales bacterium]
MPERRGAARRPPGPRSGRARRRRRPAAPGVLPADRGARLAGPPGGAREAGARGLSGRAGAQEGGSAPGGRILIELEWLAIGLLLFAGATLQSFLGFGYGIVAMTVLAVTVGVVHASGVVNITAFIQVAWVAWALRQQIRWNYVARLIPGLVVGLGLGLFTLKNADPTLLIQALGVTIVGIAVFNLATRRAHGHGSPFWDFVVGFSSGAIGGAFNTGGPPIVAYLYQRPDPPEALKATVQMTFLTFTILRLVSATAVGLIDGAIVRTALLATPCVLAGAATGLVLARRVSAERFRTISWIALGVMGAVLAARA